jgi:acyl carrier protein
MCRLFADTLGVLRVSVNDSFFELGGHSILAIRLISRVRSECDVEITLRDFLRGPTPGILAHLVDKMESGPDDWSDQSSEC